jgi:hypothetical protein
LIRGNEFVLIINQNFRTMKKLSLLAGLFILYAVSFSQVSISTDGTNPASSAMLDVKSTTKGLLLPRMTFEQRNSILSPTEGLMVFCTNCATDGSGLLSVYQGGKWRTMALDCLAPDSPAEGSHVQTSGQIIWNWSAVPIAIGYKWSTTNNYATATNVGTATTRIESGLTTGNTYLRYVWAFNSCGSSVVTVLAGQALNCGSSFSRTHSSGVVAPVTKTVTYGTIANIPGETSKCWITRNLGATQPANTVDDDSEGAAGWYWPFNRQQGYKHDGTTLTPAWTVSTIDENSDWLIENDPCDLLLGSSWRIPTYTEWYNVDNSGSWSNWNGPWTSGLQLHAAGSLHYTNGGLIDRGDYGRYRSSTQYSSTTGWYLIFNSGTSYMYHSTGKASGLTVRCLRGN